jgi:hypothetical protein
MSDEPKTVSIEAVDRMMKALVGIIIDQDALIARLAPKVDHSCAVVERQISVLLQRAGMSAFVSSMKIHHILTTDPADE